MGVERARFRTPLTAFCSLCFTSSHAFVLSLPHAGGTLTGTQTTQPPQQRPSLSTTYYWPPYVLFGEHGASRRTLPSIAVYAFLIIAVMPFPPTEHTTSRVASRLGGKSLNVASTRDRKTPSLERCPSRRHPSSITHQANRSTALLLSLLLLHPHHLVISICLCCT